MATDRLMSEGAEKASPGEAFMNGAVPDAPENPLFDPMAWLAGAKPIERTVRLVARLDLMADRDRAAIERDEARLVDPVDSSGQIAALTERIQVLTDEMVASTISLRLRGLTSSKAKEVVEAGERAGIKEPEGFVAWWITAHIVEPAGLTFEWVKQVQEKLPVQYHDLETAVTQINNVSPDVVATVPL